VKLFSLFERYRPSYWGFGALAVFTPHVQGGNRKLALITSTETDPWEIAARKTCGCENQKRHRQLVHTKPEQEDWL